MAIGVPEVVVAARIMTVIVMATVLVNVVLLYLGLCLYLWYGSGCSLGFVCSCAMLWF